MKQAYPHLSVDGICWLFGITRQAYYKYYREQRSALLDEELIIEEVRRLRLIHPRMGARKLLLLLQPFFATHALRLGRDALFDLLKRHELLIRRRRRKWVTTWSRHPFRKYPNLILGVTPQRANQIWVSDITYLPTGAGHLYLSFITDAYSRKVVGWDVANNLESVNALEALKMATATLLKGTEGLIHHSDRGSQYCCHEYVGHLKKRGISISMTQNGDPLENAIAERLNGIIKNEYLAHLTITSKAQARQVLQRAIVLYNEQRPHLSLDYLTPRQVHEEKLPAKRAWKNYYQRKHL